MMYDYNKRYDYENGFYATAGINRVSKFVAHLDLFRMVSRLRGEIVECGVFRGNSLFRWIKLRNLLENMYSRKVIAFDTFAHFPETSFELDKKERELFISETKGGLSLSRDEIVFLLEKQNLNHNIELIEGNILYTAKDYVAKNPQLKISLLHVDVDIYEATKAVLEVFYPHVVRGGCIIFDDYGDFAGANKAVDDYFNNINILKLSYANAISYIVKK
ncbi:MAG: TylF/MycF family methyltransferase [Candidatus Omnitrophica bacterium]|nr:TylF/MycF family methyltransferase [Candidatus Omnitrophota bacterium]